MSGIGKRGLLLWLRARGLLTFANVTAMTALVISLGGASYAAVVLPADSVGSRQLKDRSVQPRTLAFPLRAATKLDGKPEPLPKGPCNAPAKPGGAINVLCPPPGALGIESPGHRLELSVAQPGDVLLIVTLALSDETSETTPATVTLKLSVDRHEVGHAVVSLTAGQQLPVSLQKLVAVPRGLHTVAFAVGAGYRTAAPGDVVVTSSSLIAVALPRG